MNLARILLSIRASLLLVAAILLFSSIPRTQAANSGLTLSNLVSFPASQDSTTSLVQGTNGNFYGATANGGTNGMGAVFMVTPANANSAATFINLISFVGTNGSAPMGPLLLAADGYFYGTTFGGGTGFKGSNANSGDGTIFRMLPSGASFKSYALFSGTNGANPACGLVQGPRGYFYGTTSAGGLKGAGEVFAWSPTLGFSNLFSFSGTNGSNPRAGLVAGLDGNWYGTTFQGGTDGLGTVFQLTPSNTLTTLVSFDETDGALPWGLVQTANSNLFGTTFAGGSNHLGEIFEWTPSRRLMVVSFNITNGSNPNAPLLVGRDSFLYGTTLQGGQYGEGEVFRVTNNFSAPASGGGRGRSGSSAANVVTLLEASFQGTSKAGAYPEGGLIQASNGNFYGTTTSGGQYGTGTVFELLGFAPTIYQQPASVNFALKATASFSVGATGSGPLNYQWVFDGTNLSDQVGITGITNSQLTVSGEVLNDAGSYSVVITNSFGAITSSIVTLTIPAPVLAITSPKTGVTVANSVLLVNGTASDKYGVSSVMYQLNGGSNWIEAKSTNQWANWSATVDLATGSNIFQAYSVDPLGNHSLTQTIAVFYSVKSPLTLQTTGFGTITRSFTGSLLEVGTNYTVTAKPAVNNLFSNWTGSIIATNNPLTFLMQSNMSLTANFVTNSFLSAAGIYNGLFFVTNGIGPQSSGMLKSLTIGKLGTYTGTISIGGNNYSIAGNFDVSGNASNQIARPSSLGSLSVLMNLNWDVKPPQVTGSVSGKNGSVAWTASLIAEEAGTALASAEYTLLIPPTTNAPVVSPIGDGYAVITNHTGTATLTGALADGTAFSQSVAESESGYLAVYATPYTNGGLVLGWLTLTNGTPAGSLTWIKPASASGLYTNGFTNMVAVQSSVWNWNDRPSSPPGMPPLPLTLDIFGAFLAASIDFSVAIDYAHNDLAFIIGQTNSLSSSITPKTGLLNITFGNGNGKKTTSGTGVILQNNATGGGYFITTTNAGAFTLQP